MSIGLSVPQPKLLRCVFACWMTIGTWGHTAHPTVIIVMTDDQGIGDFNIQGNRVIRTPEIDQLAR